MRTEIQQHSLLTFWLAEDSICVQVSILKDNIYSGISDGWGQLYTYSVLK